MATKMAAPKVDVTKLKDLDVKKTINYGEPDEQGNYKTQDVVFRDPGYETLMLIKAKQNIGDNQRDIGEMANLINENVIINPRFGFSDLNKAVLKKDESKEVELEGRQGKKPHILIKFPGYRAALNVISDVRGVNGADSSLDVLQELNSDVFRRVDKPDSPLNMQFWSENGGGVQAITEATIYFTEVMDRKGYLSILNSAATFLQPLY